MEIKEIRIVYPNPQPHVWEFPVGLLGERERSVLRNGVLEAVWHECQNIDDEDTVAARLGHRSMMVGDVVHVTTGLEESHWVVARRGFRQVTIEAAKQIARMTMMERYTCRYTA